MLSYIKCLQNNLGITVSCKINIALQARIFTSDNKKRSILSQQLSADHYVVFLNYFIYIIYVYSLIYYRIIDLYTCAYTANLFIMHMLPLSAIYCSLNNNQYPVSVSSFNSMSFYKVI